MGPRELFAFKPQNLTDSKVGGSSIWAFYSTRAEADTSCMVSEGMAEHALQTHCLDWAGLWRGLDPVCHLLHQSLLHSTCIVANSVSNRKFTRLKRSYKVGEVLSFFTEMGKVHTPDARTNVPLSGAWFLNQKSLFWDWRHLKPTDCNDTSFPSPCDQAKFPTRFLWLKCEACHCGICL